MKYSTLCLLVFAPGGLSLFFILGEKDRHCFYEDYESDVLIRFEFNATLRKMTTPVGMVIKIYEADSRKELFSKEYASDSTVSYRTGEAGTYATCVLTDSKKWAMYATDSILVHFRIVAEYMPQDDAVNTGVSKQVVSKVKKATTKAPNADPNELNEWQGPDASLLHSVERRIDIVKKDLRWLQGMTRASKEIEAKFREMAEETNSRVLIWASVQIALLLATGWWQMRSLKAFFLSKKLV